MLGGHTSNQSVQSCIQNMCWGGKLSFQNGGGCWGDTLVTRVFSLAYRTCAGGANSVSKMEGGAGGDTLVTRVFSLAYRTCAGGANSVSKMEGGAGGTH